MKENNYKKCLDSLIIAKALPQDAQNIINFLNIVGGESDYLTFGLNEFPYTLEEEISIIKKCLEQNDNLMLVGKIDNEIVSQLFLQRSNKLRIKHIGDIGISVSKTYWGQKIGYTMLCTAIEYAKLHDITKITLSVRTDNLNAIYLYKKLGFVIEGTITRAKKIGEIYYDNHIMGLNI